MRRSNRARSGKKRNRSSSKANKRAQVPKTKKVANLAWDDADVTSEEEADPKSSTAKVGSDTGELIEDEETIAQKRVRTAKDFIRKLEAQIGSDDENAEEDEEEAEEQEDSFFKTTTTSDSTATNTTERVNKLLEADAFVKSGVMRRAVADKVEAICSASGSAPAFQVIACRKRAHKAPITSVVLSADGKTAFTAAKDCTITKWDLSSGCQKVCTYPGYRNNKHVYVNPRHAERHTNEVLALALSTDGRYLVSGGRDKAVRLWDARTNEYLETFMGHLDAVSCLAFQTNTHMLFSGSHDRTVKVWNLSDMAYVETLYGHQSPIEGLDSFRKERCVTSSNDNTARLFKVVEEVQLVFRGDRGESLDCIAMLNESRFVTGGNSGALQLWSVTKKKPLCKVTDAHGKGNWISAVAAIKNGDLVASGSCDGFVRIWRYVAGGSASGGARAALAAISNCHHPVCGFVNGLKFSQEGSELVVVTGREHRLGRWWRDAKAKNSLIVIRLC